MEQYFDRYFHPTEQEFVSDVFRTIANIALDMTLRDANGNLNPDLSTTITESGLHPLFSQLTISLGDDPIVPEDERDCEEGGEAYFTIATDFIGGSISFCTVSFGYPSLDDILNPPDEWRGKPGFGCDGLLDRDTNLMLPAGGVILHEMMHWFGLFEYNVPDWDTVIALDAGGYHQVSDYEGPPGGVPEEGYGPYDAPLLKNLPQSPFSPTVNNADNYVYYAVSKYWSIKCNKQFTPATSEGDNKLRDTSFNPFTSGASSSPSPPRYKRRLLHDYVIGNQRNDTFRTHTRTSTPRAI